MEKKYWDRRRENRAEPTLELLPPNKKFPCPDCKNKFRKLWKCRDGIKRCKMCKRNQITNKFYIPIEERKNLQGTIGKFSMNAQEKKQLHNKFMSGGLDSEQAWIKVRQHIRLLKNQRKSARWSDKQRRRHFAIKAQAEKKLRKMFLRGLR